MSLALRVAGAPEAFAGRLRALAAEVDPAFRLERVVGLDQVVEEFDPEEVAIMGWFARALMAVTAAIVLLATAGVYSLMSFTVSRRIREIGIRSALGAQPSRILGSIFVRALGQVGAGAFLGALVGWRFGYFGITTGEIRPASPGVLAVVAACTMAVGLLAAIVPTRRGLAVQPTEALRADV